MSANTLNKQQAVEDGTFVGVAYRMYDQPNGDPLHPPQPQDFPPGYHVTAWIHMSDFAIFGEKYVKFYGFVARSNTDSYSHLIAVRGTEKPIEWWDDAVFIPVRFEPAPSAGLVHMGFYRIYRTMRVVRYELPAPGASPPAPRAMTATTFADQIEELLDVVPPEKREFDEHGVERKHDFVVAGHSLGAALCTLYVMEHAVKKRADPSRKVVINRLCTFASPRVALGEFARQFDALPIDSWRIANAQDLVPKVPPSWLCGYRHVETGYEFSSAGVVRCSLACWHSMRTYLHWLDSTLPLDPNCLNFKETRRSAMISQMQPGEQTGLDQLFLGSGTLASILGVILLAWPFLTGHFIARPSFALAVTVGGVGWIWTAIVASRSRVNKTDLSKYG